MIEVRMKREVESMPSRSEARIARIGRAISSAVTLASVAVMLPIAALNLDTALSPFDRSYNTALWLAVFVVIVACLIGLDHLLRRTPSRAGIASKVPHLVVRIVGVVMLAFTIGGGAITLARGEHAVAGAWGFALACVVAASLVGTSAVRHLSKRSAT